MFRSHNFRLLLALLFLVPFVASAKGGVTAKGQGEPLIAEKYPSGLTENDLKDLSLTDPSLRVAYIWLMRSANPEGPIVDESQPAMVAILNDLRRRGDSATPMLLDILKKSHDSIYQDYMPGIIARVGTIKMDPYVEYLRKVIQDRPEGISPTFAGDALGIFFVYGTKEDVKMVEVLTKNGTGMAAAIKTAFEREQRRNMSPTKSANLPTTPALIPDVEPEAPENAPWTNPAPTKRSEGTSTTPWSVVTVVAIAAALGLLWLLSKRRS